MPKIDIASVAKIIREVAAAEIMPRFRKLAEGDVEMKGVNDPVTIADRAAEAALAARFAALAPGSVVVGEESHAGDPGIVAHFSGAHDVWVIDPIDGTRNFISGKPEFAVMVGLVRRRRTVAAWIHDPNTGDTLTAEQGGGVWLGEHKMHLACKDAAVPTIGIIGARLNRLLKKPETAAILGEIPAMEAGSAASFDYGRLFTGQALFARSAETRARFLLYRQSKPWDHVPGLFMLGEAGGYAADLTGRPYDMENGKNGLLLAADEGEWRRIHTAFAPAIKILLTM